MKDYLATIATVAATGQATEHSYRAAGRVLHVLPLSPARPPSTATAPPWRGYFTAFTRS